MKPRRSGILFLALVVLSAVSVYAKKTKEVEKTDREKWVEVCYAIAAPVLENMSKGELRKNMQLELSPNWDGRDPAVSYMECFGRLMAGITPWLALPDDGTEEGKMRKQLHEWALLSYKNAVDPESPDYLLWGGSHPQPLVDAAYVAESFLRAPEATWEQLDTVTQKRYIELFKGMRKHRPAYNNWLLFRGMIEAFLLMAEPESADNFIFTTVGKKIDEWYLGDGMYGDGPELAFDNYNAFVIHPMYIEMLETVENHPTPENKWVGNIKSDLAVKRMQRYNQFIERLISPEGTYPAFGRSVVYRLGAFQTLAMAAWKYGLPQGLSNGSVRSALTAVMENMFSQPGNFNDEGFLALGFVGHQPNLANSYTNNGSLYITSSMFMPLGLPADHPFWTDPAEPWTQKRAWAGGEIPIDGHVSLKK
ncbi:MAG: DUF2264 domain-containing protein [Muribaculaceae bacterium]|nr:DUF2264 domain-containing protein [Muribaculaceae bacterium]